MITYVFSAVQRWFRSGQELHHRETAESRRALLRTQSNVSVTSGRTSQRTDRYYAQERTQSVGFNGCASLSTRVGTSQRDGWCRRGRFIGGCFDCAHIDDDRYQAIQTSSALLENRESRLGKRRMRTDLFFKLFLGWIILEKACSEVAEYFQKPSLSVWTRWIL